MRAHVTKLTAVAAMAVGLALGGSAEGATPVTLPHWEGLDGAGGSGNARMEVVQLDSDRGGEARAGRMVGRSFVGFQFPE
jgi:hypothetical protein